MLTVREKESRRLIRTLYKDICGYTISREEDKAIRKARSFSTYGEITFASAKKIADYLKLGPKDVIYDLGSGVGKFVHQIGMTKKIHKCVGIELANSRYEDAMRVLVQVKRMKDMLRTTNTQFVCGNILEQDLSDATAIYTCSTAFPLTFMDLLAKKLGELKKGTKIISTQSFEDLYTLKFVGKMKLDMTWARGTSVWVYKKG